MGSEATQEQDHREPNVAFGRFVKPEMYDVFGDYNLGEVTEAEKDWLTPEQIGEIIFAPPKTARFTVDSIALNTYEHGLLARFPHRIIETAEQRTIKDNDLDDELIATSKRAQIHALESKHESMNVHKAKLLEQRGLIKELTKEARTPGFAHKSPQRMKELTSAAWIEFKAMLDVVHLQRDWNDDQRNRAEATLIHYLTQGSQRERVGHWWAMIDLADNYLGARLHIFKGRISKTDTLLRAKQTEYDQRFA
ncbi:hypothetical protein H0X10_01850 [Candidatus Saccharibacteria bacterium]|nr:hypothetical protein [Candidatus Saccharibacteria bacterium]